MNNSLKIDFFRLLFFDFSDNRTFGGPLVQRARISILYNTRARVRAITELFTFVIVFHNDNINSFCYVCIGFQKFDTMATFVPDDAFNEETVRMFLDHLWKYGFNHRVEEGDVYFWLKRKFSPALQSRIDLHPLLSHEVLYDLPKCISMDLNVLCELLYSFNYRNLSFVQLCETY